MCLLASWGITALSLVVKIVLERSLDFVLSAFHASDWFFKKRAQLTDDNGDLTRKKVADSARSSQLRITIISLALGL